jgi:methylenetetrahydrofolate dehydrogenase (NADP+)/methenyltetrahydrofolate cyclohydrolase
LAQILSSKEYTTSFYKALKSDLGDQNIHPGLAIITVGDDPASKVYVRNKVKAANEIGIHVDHLIYDTTITNEILIREIERIGRDPAINGIIIQLPLPKHLDIKLLQYAIPKEKDVDGFRHDSPFNSCTPNGCLALLQHYNISVEGKHCVVIGRSNIVGKPLAKMLLDANATVTVCHSKTPHDGLVKVCRAADIIFASAGTKNLITNEMITPETIVVDISINRNDEGKLCGDADPAIYDTIAAYTPVPGGIGPMTVAMLMWNVRHAYWCQRAQKATN